MLGKLDGPEKWSSDRDRRSPPVLRYFTDGKRHLVCSPFSVENLHIMARDLGIHRCWFHSGKYPHYDIPKRRITEISAKCILISSKELFKIISV